MRAGPAAALACAAVAVAAAGLLASAEEDPLAVRSAVVDVTEDNYDEVLEEREYMMLFFYAPWCGHCAEMKPHFEQAAENLARDGVDVTMASIDATVNMDIAAEHSLTGYPTLRWFANRDGEATTYEGDRAAAPITNWIKRHTGAGAPVLASKEDVYKFKSDNAVCVVGYFTEEEMAQGTGSFSTFSELALDTGFPLAASTVWTKGVDTPRVVLYKHYDEGEAVYSGAIADGKDAGGGSTLTREGLVKFIDRESFPATIEFLPQNVARIFKHASMGDALEAESYAKHFLLFSNSETVSSHDEAVAAMAEAYASYKGDLINVVVDLAKLDVTGRIVAAFDITEADIPCLRGFDVGGNRKHPFAQPFEPTVAYMEEMAMQFLLGKTKGKVAQGRSGEAPPPEELSDDSIPVKTVVGDSFAEVVLDPDRHVLLEVYAPWCEHCKAFEGSYEMIGQDMQERYGDAIRVVKMDGESNEVEGLDIDSYPTLLFWPAQAGLSSSDGTMADGQTPWTWSYEKDEMLERMRGLLFGLAKDHEFDAAVEKSKVRAQKAEADAAAAAADSDELLGGGGGATITMDAEDASDGWDDHDEL
jgi:protein disulfide-isomerase A1